MREWPLVGRFDEFERVSELLTSPQHRGVVLAGPVGVGKTRLAHECLVAAEEAGIETVHVVATRSAAQLPFGAVAPLLHAAAPLVPADRAATGLGPAGGDGVDERLDLLRRSVSALAERRDGRRLVLFVDDAHLLDDASATLVHQAAVTGAAVVLATVRTGEAAPDPIVALWKDRLVARVELEPLDEEATRGLLTEVVDGPVDPAAAVQFMERCRGNALFLRELVMGALDDDNLYEDRGIWRLRRELAPSPRLVEIVEARLAGLDEDERALMEVVAYGEPLGMAELSALSSPELADALERRGLLASDMDGRRLVIHLAHPLYGDVVRARTSALRARTVTTALADAVDTTGTAREDDALRVAGWRLTAGGGGPETLLRGARAAGRRFDFALAERLADAAVAAGDTGATFDAELFAAHMASRQGRREEAGRALARLAGEASTDAERGRVAIARFDNSVAFVGRDELKVLDEAEASITDQGWRDRVAAYRLNVLLNAAGPGPAYEAARPLLDHAEGETLAFACSVGAFCLNRLGRIEEAEAVATRGEQVQGAGAQTVWYAFNHTLARLYSGGFDEVDAMVSEAHRRALDEGSIEDQALYAGLDAAPVADRGRPRSALRSAREALALNGQLGRVLLVRQNHVHAALALALSGRAPEAADELAALAGLDAPMFARDEPDVLRARAWVAAAAGDLRTATERFGDAARLARGMQDRVGESEALHGTARMGWAGDVRERLAELSDEIDGRLSTARSRHADALARRSAGELEQVSREFEGMGADLLAAEAATDAAVARRRAGEAREAAAAELRAGNLADRAEGPVTPALQATEARARLTPAERETAVLAGSGRSNKDIADQLFLSPRTVENRLQRVYEKLGVTGRTELAEALALEE